MEERITALEEQLKEFKIELDFLIENSKTQLEMVNIFTESIKNNTEFSKKVISRIESLDNQMNNSIIEKMNE